MRKLIQNGLVLSAALFAAAGSGASAQDAFPNGPVRIIVNSAAGASTDLSARQYADLMSETLGQPVVVENRVGGGGLIGIQYVMDQPADGQTLLVSAGTINIQQALRPSVGYSMGEDLIPVGLLMRSPIVLVTGSNTPYESMEDIVSHAEENPGELSFGTAGLGTTTHIGPEMFMVERGLEVEMVPYQGSSAGFPDTIEGRVDGQFSTVTSVTPHVEAGAMRMLAITSEERDPSLPDIPTFAEFGVPDYSYYIWYGMFAPADTPDKVIKALSDAMLEAQNDEGFKEWVGTNGAELVPMNADEFAEFVANDLAMMNAFVEKTGLTLE
ncbi:Bug family tripartite tricarboxylate transporter substrate binding protein [Celeribacter indicus]|uniref:Tripartite tricarboxylate transporter substrate binding protein n=1 Tax=Celeribacter indicus TaxID=1208324 RepID=A0A0B5DTH3_9RHOB|nr:tripartite tricarboxylate transporter substrate binding protein [Celeribacter indicus]AJE46728.1 hypothetical protein P73_2013 [Celeribacter indicus]SDX04957.1 Tripartite-type tricarboxylate transporter, receptor component TctC [Celeribacter indicus]